MTMNHQEKKLLYKADCLDISDRNFDVDELVTRLGRIYSVSSITLVDISRNLTSRDAQQPAKMDQLMAALQRMMSENKNITALLLAGNYLFEKRPHPANNHLRDYLLDLSAMLVTSSITEIDISDNNVIGNMGRQLSGLAALCRQFLLIKGTSFTCRSNELNSSSFLFVSECLGSFSSITYLDLSDNFATRDSSGTLNIEGIRELSSRLSQTMKLKTLILARNALCDDSISFVFDAVAAMPQIQTVDVSGNIFGEMGAEAVKRAILSHSLNLGRRMCLKDLNLSGNPLGPLGMEHIAEAMRQSNTISTLSLSQCLIDKSSLLLLQNSFLFNHVLTKLNISSNLVTPLLELKAQTEVEANCHLRVLDRNALAVDTASLSPAVYSALARKLKYLSKETVMKLHNNRSFNEPHSPMAEALHYLHPPARHDMFLKIKENSTDILGRLEQVARSQRRINAAWTIFNTILSWYERFKIHRIKLHEGVIGARSFLLLGAERRANNATKKTKEVALSLRK